MNYLAHIFLSGNDADLLTGNFIADSVKGEQYLEYAPGIQNGIILHRRIDNFTDHHPLVHNSKLFFTDKFDKYSGVLIDIFYDHFLAKNFSKFSSVALNDYAASRYRLLKKHYSLFPERSRMFYGYMTSNNILVAYADIDGVEKVLRGMTHRIQNRFLLYEAIPSFLQNYKTIEKDFFLFFRELTTEVGKLKKNF